MVGQVSTESLPNQDHSHKHRRVDVIPEQVHPHWDFQELHIHQWQQLIALQIAGFKVQMTNAQIVRLAIAQMVRM